MLYRLLLASGQCPACSEDLSQRLAGEVAAALGVASADVHVSCGVEGAAGNPRVLALLTQVRRSRVLTPAACLPLCGAAVHR